MEASPLFLASLEAVGRIWGAGWINCISRSLRDDFRGVSVGFHEEASPTSLLERLARTTTMIYAGAFLDGESDSKRERAPRCANIRKTQQIITTCWGWIH